MWSGRTAWGNRTTPGQREETADVGEVFQVVVVIHGTLTRRWDRSAASARASSDLGDDSGQADARSGDRRAGRPRASKVHCRSAPGMRQGRFALTAPGPPVTMRSIEPPAEAKDIRCRPPEGRARPQVPGPAGGPVAGPTLPDRPLRPGPPRRLRAAGGHGPLGPVHRRAGQQGHARPLRPLPRRPRPWPGPTWPRSRRWSIRPASSGPRRGTSSPWPGSWSSATAARSPPTSRP